MQQGRTFSMHSFFSIVLLRIRKMPFTFCVSIKNAMNCQQENHFAFVRFFLLANVRLTLVKSKVGNCMTVSGLGTVIGFNSPRTLFRMKCETTGHDCVMWLKSCCGFPGDGMPLQINTSRHTCSHFHSHFFYKETTKQYYLKHLNHNSNKCYCQKKKNLKWEIYPKPIISHTFLENILSL